jgi:DNA helicase IV
MLFGASDLGRLGEKLEDLFKLQPFVPKTGLSTEILNGLSQGLTSTFQLLPALWCELEDQERKLIRMTEDQLDVLAMLEAHPRVTIQGVAGSGKTVLAMSKAREFADRGGNVLFLCFNEMLAEWLRAALPSSYEGRVTVRNYHKLCSEWAKAAGIPWPKNTDSMFFSREAPQLLEQAIDLLPERCFDAVVVDEGQDFQPGWWDTVELLNKRPCEGSLYIFFDPDQQVFHESLAAMPRLSGPFKLPVNCRNTKQIASRCGSILSKIIPVKAGSPDGRKPKFIHAQSSEEQIREADRQVAEWTGTPSRLRLGQIAVVTRGSLQASSLAGVAKLADQPVTNDLKVWRDNRGILLTSLYRFKGLEADALILADVIPPDPMAPLGGFRPEHFYVGCSRAKHLLTIISYSEDWE